MFSSRVKSHFIQVVDLSWRQVGDKLYTDLDYADDVLMAEQTATLRSALVEFHQTAANLGLHCICHGRKLRYRTWVPVNLRQI